MRATESSLRNRVSQADLSVDLIDDIDRFAGLRAEWTDLVQHSSSHNPFLTWEWLHAWSTIHLSATRTLHIVTVRDEVDWLVGVAPLCVSRGRLPWLTELEFLGTGRAGSDYLDLIARRGFEKSCVDVFETWFRSREKTLLFDHLRPNGLARRLGQRLTESQWSRESTLSGICPFARLQNHSWESYIDTLRPSQRSRSRRHLNALRNKFAVDFMRVETDTQRQEALGALIGFHERRSARRDGSTTFQTSELQSFHHDVTSRALEAGWLRMFALRLNDDIAAVTYCFYLNGRFYLYQHGFNPAFWPYSVDAVVLGLTIQSAIDEGAAEFDMLCGEEPYKSLWTTETRQLERIELFPPHIGGRLHRHTVDAERNMRLLARRIFSRRPCDSNVPPAGVAS